MDKFIPRRMIEFGQSNGVVLRCIVRTDPAGHGGRIVKRREQLLLVTTLTARTVICTLYSSSAAAAAALWQRQKCNGRKLCLAVAAGPTPVVLGIAEAFFPSLYFY